MDLDDKKREELCDLGPRLLDALESVEKAARGKLRASSPSVSGDVFAGGSNTVVDGDRAIAALASIRTDVREHLARLMREPFVARVKVEWYDSDPPEAQTLYISRASAVGLAKAIPDAELATYAAPLGRVAEFEPGEFVALRLGGRERELRILERVQLRPEQKDGAWDALDDHFEFLRWQVAIESIRRFLQELGRLPAELSKDDILGAILRGAARAELVRQRARRKVVDRIALRDQPILDQYQGEVFRMPLDRQLFLFGPPGSGKTTTLVRRVAQKRTPGALTEEEEATIGSLGIGEALVRDDSWAMFSPTELLKLYLRDAFNREGVPAADLRNLRTWEKERLDLARNALRILRSAESGRFQLDESMDPFLDSSSGALSSFHDEVAAVVEESVLNNCNDAIQKLLEDDDEAVRTAVARLQKALGVSGPLSFREVSALLDRTELREQLSRLSGIIKDQLNHLGNGLLGRHKGLLDEIEALPGLVDVQEDDDEDVEEEGEEGDAARPSDDRRAVAAKVLLAALRAQARASAQGRSRAGGRAGRVADLLGDRLPTREQLTALGKRILTRRRLRSVANAARELVLGVPKIYARLRREALREGRIFRPEAAPAFSSNRISPHETDALILIILRNARRLLQHGDGSRLKLPTAHDWLESIKSRYLIQVFVDEATDLSAVQLACTVELTHPGLRSWFAGGDVRQRITQHGVQSISELDWLNRVTGVAIEPREISVGYRQTKRLRELAEALSRLDDAAGVTITPPSGGAEDVEAWPLIGEGLSGDSLAAWLAHRIAEVEQTIGRLPSIAVFVDGESRIDPLVESTQGLLAERNIRIVACKDGRVVGDALEVRVFDVRHIKGLEFEAVFFVGVDRLAEEIPDLFHRFVYVGVTRAATYLGVTCEADLPERLASVRPYFRAADWSRVDQERIDDAKQADVETQGP